MRSRKLRSPWLISLSRTLLDNPSLGGFDESDQHVYIFAAIRLCLQLFQSLRRVHLRGQQDLVGVMNSRDALFGEATALETNFVHAVGVRVARGRRHGER